MDIHYLVIKKYRNQVICFNIVLDGVKMRKRTIETIKQSNPDAVDIILQLTQRNENRRLGAGRGAKIIKEHPFFELIHFEDLRKENISHQKIWIPPSDMKKVVNTLEKNIDPNRGI